MSVGAAHRFFQDLKPAGALDQVASLILDEIRRRLGYLVGVGLEYLTLDRQSRTLSGGELERVDLTTAIGSSLVNTLYVLDEPSIGLHPRDSRRLVEILHRLRANHNTVVVVEHDPEIIKECDHVIDLGPKAGEHGGEVMFAGSYQDLLEDEQSLTAAYLSQRKEIPVPAKKRKGAAPALDQDHRRTGEQSEEYRRGNSPRHARLHHRRIGLRANRALVDEVIHRNLKRLKEAPAAGITDCASIAGIDKISEVVLVDQSPVGTTPRSNPATYMKAFDGVRRLFAAADLSRLRGYTPSTFSFNVEGGRCETCRGEGYEKVEMQFLSDVYTSCAECHGSRFREEVLEVFYRGKNIRQVLDLTVAEALEFFRDTKDVSDALAPLRAVGLEYVRLGQPLTTLVGRRVAALEIGRAHGQGAQSAATLFIFDEPTTGLHFHDIERLLWAFNELIDQGHSIVVIEQISKWSSAPTTSSISAPRAATAAAGSSRWERRQKSRAAEHSHTGVYLRPYLRRRKRVAVRAGYGKRRGPHRAAPAIVDGNAIAIVGAKEHNLKNISVDIPRDRFIVFTGLSGSGKSSLAFDIVYAEGQRRYIDSLSAYARQFLEVMARPNVDYVAGIPPTVAIEQRLSQGGKKSTVATVTEIYHYLRLLYSKIGKQHCVQCGRQIHSLTRSQILDRIGRSYRGKEMMVLSPIVRGRKGFHKEVIAGARRLGYRRARIDGKLVDLRAPELAGGLERFKEHNIDIAIGKTKAGGREVEALIDQGLRLGNGVVHLISERGEQIFNQRLFCLGCGIGYEPLDPRIFSFNSQQGACGQCAGMGFTWDFDPELIFADPRRPLREAIGGISPGSRCTDRKPSGRCSACCAISRTNTASISTRRSANCRKQRARKFFTAAAGERRLSGWCRFSKNFWRARRRFGQRARASS